MPTEAEEIKELKARAKLHFDAIVEGGGMTSKGSMMVGYHAYRMKEENLFGVMGFGTEEEARKASGVGESTWYANIALAKQFKDLSEKKFVGMKQANAKALADLPDSKKCDPQWVKDASHMKCEDFAAQVDKELNGKAKASEGKEKTTSMKVGMSVGQKAVIEENVRVFAEAQGLDAGDVGKVFEVMSIEVTQGDSLVGIITGIIQQMRDIKAVIASNLSADEALIKINAIVDEVIMDVDHKLAKQEQAA